MSKRPKWKCERCGKPVNYLHYCSHCWSMICEDCYDPFVGTCKECVRELFNGNTFASTKAIRKKKSELSAFTYEETNLCPECGGQMITTPDGTKCCSSCGLVRGVGYSWMGSSNSPRESDAWHQYEYLYEKSLERYERIVRKNARRP